MSKNGKIDYPDGNEDIQWFENYEKHKTKHRETLKNEDILNYIKDVEQNCRIEMSSGDEDYAGTRKSSNCSVKRSGTRFRSFKKVKSRITARKNKSMTLKRERKRPFDYNAINTCNYCCSARKSYFRGNSDLTVQENSRKNLNTSTKFISRRPNLSKISYKYRESSPTLYGWYSRKNHKTWPAVTEVASLEVNDDCCQNAIYDSRISRSNITDRKSAKIHTLKSLRRNEFDDSYYMNICPNFPPSKKTERNSRYRNRKHREETRMRKLNQESAINNFETQQPLNKIYSSQDTMFSYQVPLQNGDYKERYTSEYRYPVRRSRQPPSRGLSSRSNRLIASTRLPETNSLLQRQTLQWENEIRPPSKAFSSIMRASIDRSYQRGTNRKNNTDQQRRKPGILGNRESLCYRRPDLLRESRKLCKVVSTHENKQWLGCCCEDAERDETAGCSKYCRCTENANDFIRLQRESTCRPVPMSKRVNYTATTFCKTLPKSIYSEDNDEGESEINLSMEEDSQNEDAVCDNHALDIFDDVKTNNYDEELDLRDLKPRISFLDDRARRSSSEVTRPCRKLSNDLKSSQRGAMEARTTLRRKITARYPAGKAFSFAIRTPGKPMSGDTSGLRYDAAKSTCDCKEPFHDPPAACSTGFCTCIGNGENTERNNSESRRISDKDIYCRCCCSCSSSISHNEKDPVKKLESFCEKVKAVNQNIFHKPSKSTCSNTRRINTQEYAHSSDEQNQSEISTQGAIRRTRFIEREWLKNPACLRLEKSKLSHDGANLEKIVIYPPRGESGPPLTLYKRSSNISCRVKGDADTGFRYSVTYVQKFVSPTWMPSLSPEVLSRETDKECDCSADYG